MREELILIWYSYHSEKFIKIGILIKEKDMYLFKYFISDVLTAIEEGCFVPFKFESTKNEITYIFDKLPIFFEKRIQEEERHKKNNLEYNPFDLLKESKGIKNSDNFCIITKEQLQEYNLNEETIIKGR